MRAAAADPEPSAPPWSMHAGVASGAATETPTKKQDTEGAREWDEQVAAFWAQAGGDVGRTRQALLALASFVARTRTPRVQETFTLRSQHEQMPGHADTWDQDAFGQLMAANTARQARTPLRLGLCGAHSFKIPQVNPRFTLSLR